MAVVPGLARASGLRGKGFCVTLSQPIAAERAGARERLQRREAAASSHAGGAEKLEYHFCPVKVLK